MVFANAFDQYTWELPPLGKPGTHLSVVCAENLLLSFQPTACFRDSELNFSVSLGADSIQDENTHIMKKARTERIVSGYNTIVFSQERGPEGHCDRVLPELLVPQVVNPGGLHESAEGQPPKHLGTHNRDCTTY